MKLDAYAPFQLARDHRLSSSEWPVLVALVLLADYRTHEWAGTIAELAEDTRQSTNTVRKVVGRLRSLGLVEEVADFGPGQHRAVMRVIAYDRLVVPERRSAESAQISANDDGSPRADQREHQAADRADFAQHSRSDRADQRELPGKTGVREERGSEGVGDVTRARVETTGDDPQARANTDTAQTDRSHVERCGSQSQNNGRPPKPTIGAIRAQRQRATAKDDGPAAAVAPEARLLLAFPGAEVEEPSSDGTGRRRA